MDQDVGTTSWKPPWAHLLFVTCTDCYAVSLFMHLGSLHVLQSIGKTDECGVLTTQKSDQLQGDDELSEPCTSEAGEMMTPPQPAPRDSTHQSTSDAEMSFRDLVDDSDEEDRAGDRSQREKRSINGQVLVDPEDLQVCS